MIKVYPKEDYCVACRLCEVYCATEHSRTKEVLRAFKEEKPPPVKRIFLEQEGIVSLAINCRHCEEPTCVWACVTGALIKDPESGVVEFLPEKCIGCWTCIVACPYGVITRDLARQRIAKCDLCPEREVPVCVQVCPNRALVLG
jgi:carbon-monoxide dehydrogenase iron sulfur subunit